MARIKDKVKIYIHRHAETGCREYHVHDLTGTCHWLTLVGTVGAVIEYDEADLVDPHTAQLNKAEQALEAHRAEFATKDRQLLDKIESLRELPHLGWIMTDRELLELAAKAAGLEVFWGNPGSCQYGHDRLYKAQPGKIMYTVQEWNPLTDDGDALRLAVQLNLDIRFDSYDAGNAVIVAGAWDDAPEGAHEIFERNGARATRRAIVRAAASIGKGMP